MPWRYHDHGVIEYSLVVMVIYHILRVNASHSKAVIYDTKVDIRMYSVGN